MTENASKSSSTIASVIIGVTGLLFTVTGIGAIIDPVYTMSFLSAGELGGDMRNEVRAMYGGMSIAMGIALFIALRRSALAPGIVAAIAMFAAGLASGRVISLLIEMPESGNPVLFLGMEIALGALLLLALRLDRVRAG